MAEKSIDEPRIGSGKPPIVFGVIMAAVGAFFLTAGQAGATAFGGALIALGAAFTIVGFWSGMFHQTERRLIELRQAIEKRAV